MKRLVMIAWLASCLTPDASLCANGGVCPAGLRCFEVDGEPACILPTCGDGRADAAESCDDGNNVSGDGCRFDCRAPCGDGVRDADEACDDGNTISGDGCSQTCSSEEFCGNGVTDSEIGEQCDDQNFRNHDGCSSTCRTEQPTWTNGDARPSGRYGHAMAYDARRGRVVLFGGCERGLDCELTDDTWEFDGTSWERRASFDAPPARAFHALAYDAVRERVVLFGGCSLAAPSGCTNYLADTWEWDGVTWTPRPTSAVPGRARHAMIFHAARGTVVMIGGDVASQPGDAWEWDGNDWSAIPGEHPARAGHAMAYDPRRDRVILFGGGGSGPPGVPDRGTLEWNGLTWLRVDRPVEPSPRSGHAMTYTSAGVMLVGGCVLGASGSCDQPSAELWRWDGAAWSREVDGGPPARGQHGIAYDSGRDQLLVLGGLDNFAPTPRDDLWSWRAGQWTVLAPVPLPPRSLVTHLAYDAVRGVIVMLEGERRFDPSTWEWNGRWNLRATPVSPGTRRGGALAYDAARARVVLFGGIGTLPTGALRDTWEWDGIQWVERLPVTRPWPRSDHSLVYDAARGRVVLIGGVGIEPMGPALEVFADTWEWDGTDWTDRTATPSLPPRRLAASTYDPGSGSVVAHGGSGITDPGLWQWDGQAWTERLFTSGPTARSQHAMAYDPLRRTLVLHGGIDALSLAARNDTWAWNATRWELVTTATRPAPGSVTAAAYDTARSQIVIFGGEGESQTWRLRYEAPGAHESCHTGFDGDRDGLIGCADPDCAGLCDPLCATYELCTDPVRPHCGDGTCSSLETCRSCAQDCGTCAPLCGDFHCDPGETCPGDC